MSEEKKRQSPFKVRLATEADLDICTHMVAVELPRENDLEYFPKTSKTKVYNKLKSIQEDKCLLVYENNGVIVGVLGLVIDSFWWSDEESMLDAVFYIKPEFRSYKSFDRMLSVAEEFAKINGLPLNLLFFSTKDIERKYKLLNRRGYKSIGFWVTRQRE